MTRPNVLLESWLPFDAIGVESMRERGASSALPPLYFLHVWWARRPLTVSRAAVVASLLPDYETVAAAPRLQDRFPTEGDYHAWFLRLMGIHGDPVADRILVVVNGAIVEVGSHAELLRARGHYYRLYTQQFRHELESEYFGIEIEI